jgi:hypothetical protein
VHQGCPMWLPVGHPAPPASEREAGEAWGAAELAADGCSGDGDDTNVRGEHHGGGGLTSGEPGRWWCRAPVSRGGASRRRGGSGHLGARRAAPPHQWHVARVVRTLSGGGRGRSSADHGGHARRVHRR